MSWALSSSLGLGGAAVTLALLVLGVPYFLPLGVITTILGLIPFIGPVLAGVITTGIALATAGITPGIIMGIIFVVYQQVENHILQPLVQRRTIQMNPLLIVITMLLGTSLAGLVGAILALPVAGAIQVLIRGLLLPDLERPA
jgi:predicted PurR-regulated permease PerM